MPKRNPEKAIQMFDAMLEFFDGGRRWTRGELQDASGQHRCLIGALHYVRRQQGIRGAGTETYLHDALLEMQKKPLDQISDPFTALLYTHCKPCQPDNKDLMSYNDGSSYDEVRELIIEARDLAQAEFDRQRDQKRGDTRLERDSAPVQIEGEEAH